MIEMMKVFYAGLWHKMYRLGKRIGDGSYGEVYSAEEEKNGSSENSATIVATSTPLALKISYVFKAASRFPGVVNLKEVDVMQRCCHPCLLRPEKVFYDMPFEALPDTFKFKVFENNGPQKMTKPNKNMVDHIFVLTPLAVGDAHVFRHGHKIPLGHLKRIIMQICQAVQYLHAHNICHRDIKINNLLLFFDSVHQGLLKGKICDFGMAKSLDLKANSTHIGTPMYRAPEIFLGDGQYDKSSDIWSLAILMYELITGEGLFINTSDKGDDEIKILKRIFHQRGRPDRETFKYLCGNVAHPIIKYSSLTGHPRKLYLNKNFEMVRDFELLPPDKIPNFGTLEQFEDLLDLMLTIDPRRRPLIGGEGSGDNSNLVNPVSVLEHPFFSSVPKGPTYGNKCASPEELKKWYGLCHEKYPEVRLHVLQRTKNASLRKIGIDVLTKMDRKFDTSPKTINDEKGWKILFLGLDIFDRCLLKIDPFQELTRSTTIDMVTLLAVCSCFLAAKYVLDEDAVHPSDMFKDIRRLYDHEIKAMEKEMLEKYLDWQVYRVTVYDCLKVKSRPDILLKVFCTGDGFYDNGPVDMLAKSFEDCRAEGDFDGV